MNLEDCKTVEEVEKICCSDCAKTGHWGWCDAPWIKCSYKDKIKEILNINESKYTSLSEQMKDAFGRTI